MKIKYKEVYGKRTIYPVDAQAKIFAEIAGTKTLTDRVVSLIRELGYEVEVEEAPVGRPSGLGDYHGSASDRGSADSYYRRGKDPHFWPNGTGNGKRVEAGEMSGQEIAAYHNGYDLNEREGNHKEY